MASSHMVDEFEKAFQNSMSLFTSQEHFNIETDTDEIRVSVEQSMQKLLDAARQLDTFFMQKRLMLSDIKSENNSPVKEDLEDLRLELQRKDLLIQKHFDKLQLWQGWFVRGTGGGGQGLPSGGTPPGQGQGPQQQQQPGTPQQGPGSGQMMMTANTQQQSGSFNNQGALASLEQTASSVGFPRNN